MKILKLKEFLTYPPNTVFCEYLPCVFGQLMLKGDTISHNDFFESQITEEIESSGSCETFNILIDAEENGTSFTIDQDCYGRNGMYHDENQLFVVYEKDDLKGIIETLTTCMLTLS